MSYPTGMRPLTPDARDLRFGAYRTTASINVPADYGAYAMIPRGTWGMNGNAVFSCCLPAGQGHAEKIFTAEGSGTPITVTVNNTLADYFAMNGVQPGPAGSPSDQGTDPRDGLKYHQQTGMLDSKGQRHKLGAYAALDGTKINNGDLSELDEATYLTGATGIGIDLPQSAQAQFSSGHWMLDPSSPSDGLHWVIVVGRWSGWYEVISWGMRVHTAADFLKAKIVCAYSLLSPEIIRTGTQTSPEGFSYSALEADVAAVTA